ncbi:MAG: CcdB family protein [Spirochaetota bacterium]
MGRFGVYANGNPHSKILYPFLLDVQSPLLDSLASRLVIPLALMSRFPGLAIARLTPTVAVGGIDYLALTPQMAAVNKRDLGPLVLESVPNSQEILSAIDFLITGF